MKHRMAIVSLVALVLLGTGFALPGWWVGPQTGYRLYLGSFSSGIDASFGHFKIPHYTTTTSTDVGLIGAKLSWRYAMLRFGAAGRVGAALGEPDNANGFIGYGGVLGELVIPLGDAEIVPGVLFGGGSYSLTDNTHFTQWSQDFLFCNPSLALDWQVNPGLRLGMVGSMMMGRPELRAWTAGVRASFGEFPMKYQLHLLRMHSCR